MGWRFQLRKRAFDQRWGGARKRMHALTDARTVGGREADDGAAATACALVQAMRGKIRGFAHETAAQSTLEYAITTCAVLALITGIAALWRAGEDGVFVELVEDAASHTLTDLGALDISLY